MDRGSSDTSPTIDDQIAYHKQLEHAAIRAGDFTKAEHHRKMQEIYAGMKAMEPNKTPEQVSDEDYKVAPTSADRKRLKEESEK